MPARKFPPVKPITLEQRLKRYVGRNVTITAANLSLEPGRLTRVLPTFIVVTKELFVPRSLHTMVVHQVGRAKKVFKVGVRTTFNAGGIFDDVELILIGKDFIELQRTGESRDRTLIPLNKVEGIFSI